MEIVEATDVELPEIVELWKEFMDFHQARDPAFARSEDGHVSFAGYARKLMSRPDGLVLVAVENGHAVGYTIAKISWKPVVFRDRRYGLFLDVAVKADHRGRGIGSALFARALEWFDSKGVKRIEGVIADKNEVASSFWRKRGFKDFQHLVYLERDDPGASPDGAKPSGAQ